MSVWKNTQNKKYKLKKKNVKNYDLSFNQVYALESSYNNYNLGPNGTHGRLTVADRPAIDLIVLSSSIYMYNKDLLNTIDILLTL